MFSSEFVWCDLSTFDLATANAFYENVFGWTQHTRDSRADDDYTFLYAGSQAAAGIFTMPQFLQDIRMPSFWMSYVRVAEISESLDLAISLVISCHGLPDRLMMGIALDPFWEPVGFIFVQVHNGQRLSESIDGHFLTPRA